MNDILQSSYYEPPLGYNNVDWFVNEVKKLEKRRLSILKTLRKISLWHKKVRSLRIITYVGFVTKNIESDKVRYHCHLTGRYRSPAHNICNINVSQQQSNIIPFIFHNFSNYDCHMFFKRLVDLKKNKVKFKIIPKTNEEHISVSYGCIRFIDSYRFFSSNLDKLVKNLDKDDSVMLKKEFPDKWQNLNKKLAYPYEYFNNIDD